MQKTAIRILALGILVAVTAGAEPSTVAPRVVSLGPAITEQVVLLGMASNLVGVTSYCVLPAGHPPVAQIGTVTGMSAEQVLSLHPDLVLATGLTHPRDTGRLEKLGLRVVQFGYAKTFEDICAQFIQIGDLMGRSELARALAEEAQRRVAAVEARVAGSPAPRVFVEIGTRPLFTANQDSFIDDLVRRAGGTNVARDAVGGFYSREQVLAANPDVILIVTMGVAADQERDAWLGTRSLSVATTRRVHVMDAYTVCSPTPLRFAESLEAMAVFLHPGAP